MNKKILTSGGLIVGLVLFMAVNIFSNFTFHSLRLDMTENNLYTLSQGSKNILKNLKEPISLRFYFSQKLMSEIPGLAGYAGRVKEMLEEYERAAAGQLNLTIIEPEPFSEEEDRAVADGLKGVPVANNTATFYFGLVATNSTDKEEVIPFLSPDRGEFLEYDLTKLVYQLSTIKQKVIGVLTTLPVMGEGPGFPGQEKAGPWVVMEQLKEIFELKNIETNVAKIPDDISVLMLIHPKNFSDTTLYAIDQYVLGGGHIVVFMDGYAEADEPDPMAGNPMAGMQMPKNSEMSRILKVWGVELTQNYVAGDRSIGKKVQINQGGRPVIVDYPIWMELGPKQFTGNDIITAKLGNIIMASPGILNKTQDSSMTFTPIIQTSDKAMKISTSQLGMLSDPQSLVRDYKPEGKLTLAARISGKLKTAFPEGMPSASAENNNEQAAPNKALKLIAANQLKESKEPVSILIVADTDVLQDRFWVQIQNLFGSQLAIPIAANNSFVINTLEHAMGNSDLISVPNRSNFSRPFTRIKDLQQDTVKQFMDTEKRLRGKLAETEQKIQQLQMRKDNQNSLILSDDQKKEIATFRQEKIKIRKELRQLQHELNKNIEGIDTTIKFINIGLIPLLIVVGVIATLILQSRKTKPEPQPKMAQGST